MSRFKYFLTITAIAYMTSVECARILAVYPMPSISHQMVFRALSRGLAKRGHELVVIASDPAFQNKTPTENITEINISGSYARLRELLYHNSTDEIKRKIKRGAIVDLIAIKQIEKNPFFTVDVDILTYPEVKSLIEDKNQKFDLVIVEALTYSPLMFSEIYKAPVVLFSSFYGLPDSLAVVGAVSRHPVLHPHVLRYKFRDLSLLEKIEQYFHEWALMRNDAVREDFVNNFFKSEFGEDAPTVHELQKNVELLLVNAHPIFDGNRPVPPGVVYLGALHSQPLKELPQDLKSYLDNSTRGIIYVSLGTAVRPSQMSQDLLDVFLDAFEALPYDIMWKFDGDHLERIPKNLKIQKWFPQRDLLSHQNVKLFIMQGGLQSTDEAIDAGLPMVGIPFVADQWYNTNKYEEFGIGIQLDSLTMTADDLVKAAKKVIGDQSYRENMAKLRSVMLDQPEQALDRAIWWTEYVLRHGKSSRLLGPTALMSWSEFLIADVLITLAVILVFVGSVVALLLYYALRHISGFLHLSKLKVKQA